MPLRMLLNNVVKCYFAFQYNFMNCNESKTWLKDVPSELSLQNRVIGRENDRVGIGENAVQCHLKGFQELIVF